MFNHLCHDYYEENTVKEAYKLRSLSVHPDRADPSGIEEATRKFQLVSKVYFILSDKDKRAVYDETGNVDDECLENKKNWHEYWRLLFPEITGEDIENFGNTNKGFKSGEEDLEECYVDSEGGLNKICECLILYKLREEEEHFITIENMIDNGVYPDMPMITKDNIRRQRRHKSLQRESAEVRRILHLNRRAEARLRSATRDILAT